VSALQHVRICDLSGQLAGAGATKILAALGAEVIRVENPRNQGRWDMMRGVGPYVDERRGPNLGGGFNNHNAGKLGVTIDLADPRGTELFADLVRISDVVTENFAAGVMERLGFGYEALRALREDVVYVSSSGFGADGPYQPFKTWGPIVQAMSGLTFTSGLPDREPAGWGFSYMDHLGAYAMALAVLVGLHARDASGEGQWIDLATTESALTLHGPALLDWTVNGRGRRRAGQPNGNHAAYDEMAPHCVYPARGDDRWVAIACRDDDDWERARSVFGAPWADDARWRALRGRLDGQDELDALIASWTAQRDADDIARSLLAVGVPASPVRTPPERIDADPDIAAWGLFPEVEHPEMGPVRVEGLPIHLSETDWGYRSAAPCLGEHNDYVLGELLGRDAATVAALRADGVV
jgi:crotonobetainyl-CoA:carnitine CoA-transferase CaiB-like acyl-CoA transferase